VPEPDEPKVDELEASGNMLRSVRSRRPNPFVYGPKWA
jgi:hypothetical protein